jgi:hypothetical protein
VRLELGWEIDPILEVTVTEAPDRSSSDMKVRVVQEGHGPNGETWSQVSNLGTTEARSIIKIPQSGAQIRGGPTTYRAQDNVEIGGRQTTETVQVRVRLDQFPKDPDGNVVFDELVLFGLSEHPYGGKRLTQQTPESFLRGQSAFGRGLGSPGKRPSPEEVQRAKEFEASPKFVTHGQVVTEVATTASSTEQVKNTQVVEIGTTAEAESIHWAERPVLLVTTTETRTKGGCTACPDLVTGVDVVVEVLNAGKMVNGKTFRDISDLGGKLATTSNPLTLESSDGMFTSPKATEGTFEQNRRNWGNEVKLATWNLYNRKGVDSLRGTSRYPSLTIGQSWTGSDYGGRLLVWDPAQYAAGESPKIVDFPANQPPKVEIFDNFKPSPNNIAELTKRIPAASPQNAIGIEAIVAGSGGERTSADDLINDVNVTEAYSAEVQSQLEELDAKIKEASVEVGRFEEMAKDLKLTPEEEAKLKELKETIDKYAEERRAVEAKAKERERGGEIK